MARTLQSKTIDRSIRLFEAIKQFKREHDRMPHLRELIGVDGIGSVSTVEYHLRNLREWGWVNWEKGSHGTLHITRVEFGEGIVVWAQKRKKAKAADVT